MMWFNKNKENLPVSLYRIVEYLLNKVKEKNLDIELIDRGVIIADELKIKNVLT